MGGSVTLFKIFGIEMRVHWSFLLIVAYQAYVSSGNSSNPTLGALYGVVTILLLFICVTLHEFGHSVVAKYYKINVPYITLLPIGGVASLERMPDKPRQEFLIAVAGPLVNVVIAALLSPFALFFLFSEVNAGRMTLTLDQILRFDQTVGLKNLVVNLFFTNILLVLFNLLPAFPMDGGRILRALLAMGMPYVQATRVAVLVGRVMAVIFALLGIFGGGVFLLLIAFFVYVGGGSELSAVESRAVLRNILANQALTRNAVNLYTSERVNRAVDLIMSSYQTDYPVLDLSNRFVGVLTRAQLIYGLKEIGPDARIVDIMLPAERVPVCTPQTTLDTVFEKMMEVGSRVAAVKENQAFLGLITVDDITELFQVIGAKLEGIDHNQSVGGKPAMQGAADA